ncbi:hypothetical protein [Gordonia sp. NB41Y]|uniref:hypothetical protein n=1 Tax=Gordonia sp. NB41Y TaxID=875808 RepID=UPI0006B1FAB3|nr:hypothetical protein [Gordonia sp. NB41Y]EMP15060.2 hypothetical protein ISGA_30 [Gordonia sp. NB41Y]WLP91327.1 hypothetical protein Q9K23_03385 [Gordonia sp. NB41Y]
MILPVLALGGGRYLDMGGDVVVATRRYTHAQVAQQRAMDPDFDPELAGMAGATYLSDDEREYWERVARDGGHELSELLVPDLDEGSATSGR